MNTFFTSDTHLGHINILGYSKRPFATVEEMNEALIANWNRAVKPKDTIYHLGDFSFGDPWPYLKRLNGRIHLIKGNHDKTSKLSSQFASVNDYLEIKIESQPIVLFHYAMRTWHHVRRGAWHLYGHSHSKLPPLGLSFDVGVDCHEYAPISFEQVADIMRVKTNILE